MESVSYDYELSCYNQNALNALKRRMSKCVSLYFCAKHNSIIMCYSIQPTAVNLIVSRCDCHGWSFLRKRIRMNELLQNRV